KRLIPKLYKAGVYNLGMEFGASENQETLDSLLTAPSYDKEIAREVMYSYNVGWAYQEYQDIYQAAWKFNENLPEGKKPFRILNLSYQYDWSNFNHDDVRTPNNM